MTRNGFFALLAVAALAGLFAAHAGAADRQ